MSADLLLALTFSLLLFAIAAWALVGWGSLITRLFRMRLDGAEQGFSQLWLGLAIVLLWLQLINYFAPINWMATTLLAVGGLVAWWFNGHALPRLPSTLHGLAMTLLYTILLLLSAGWVATRSMQPPIDYDTGFYQLQSIRWYNEYAIVPGLGNLHGPLAFNQAFFAFVAALNIYPFFNQGYALANGFLILLLTMEGWHALIFGRGASHSERSLAKFAAICALPIAAYMLLFLSPSSPSPITASSVFQVLIWLHLVRLLEQRPAMHDTVHDFANEARTRTHVILILAITAVTIHLGNLVYVAAIALIVLVRNWLVEPHPILLRLIIFFRLTWLPLLIEVIWVGRGYFLSGYPAYPSTFGGFQVDWAVPQLSVEAEARSISLMARYGDVEVATNSETWAGSWVGSWLAGLTSVEGIAGVLYPLVLTLLLWAVYGWLRWALHRGRLHRAQPDKLELVQQPSYALLALPILVALVYWWLTTPDPALVYAFFWLLPIMMAHKVLMALEAMRMGSPRPNHTLAMIVVNAAFLASFLLFWRQAAMVSPGFSSLPTPTVRGQQLPRRLIVFHPMVGESCWNERLPCTPYINPQLRRRGSRIQQGFRVLSQYSDALASVEPSLTR